MTIFTKKRESVNILIDTAHIYTQEGKYKLFRPFWTQGDKTHWLCTNCGLVVDCLRTDCLLFVECLWTGFGQDMDLL